MRIFDIKKRSGGHRRIYAPDNMEKRAFQDILSRLPVPPEGPSHAFRAHRGIVTNAAIHVGRAETVSMDLSGFFDSVHPEHLRGRVSAEVIGRCLLAVDGTPLADLPVNDPRRDDVAPRQGLPTSPRLADLAAGDLDKAIRKLLKRLAESGKPVSADWYTRYADDLTISHDGSRDLSRMIAGKIVEIISRCGFRANPEKTRYQSAGTPEHPQRREVCGLTVDGAIHTPRRFRRRMRAVLHQMRLAGEKRTPEEPALRHRAAGMAAHAACTPPRTPEQIREREAIDAVATAARLAAKFKLPSIDWQQAVARKTIPPGMIPGTRVEITVAPCDWLKMGAGLRQHGTSSATSCMRPGGTFCKGIPWWASLPGAALAVIRGEHGRIEARAILLALRDGGKRRLTEYARNPKLAGEIASALKQAGWSYESHGVVVGHITPINLPLPYFDGCRVEQCNLKSGAKAQRLIV